MSNDNCIWCGAYLARSETGLRYQHVNCDKARKFSVSTGEPLLDFCKRLKAVQNANEELYHHWKTERTPSSEEKEPKRRKH